MLWSETSASAHEIGLVLSRNRSTFESTGSNSFSVHRLPFRPRPDGPPLTDWTFNRQTNCHLLEPTQILFSSEFN
jgi:hypothetical protein